MFKHSEKRFEYDIGSHPHEEADRYEYKYANYRNNPDNPISATTPINRRSSLNHSSLEQRERLHISTQDPILFQDNVDDRQGMRSRGNSTSGFKKSMEKLPARNYLQNQNYKQTKKVYLGQDEMIQRESQSTCARNKQYRGSYRNDENRRLNGQDQGSFPAYDNPPIQNAKSNTYGEVRRKKEGHWPSVPQYNLNEKEIMEKISRINKLNEEINSRLQRMLSKIEHP